MEMEYNKNILCNMHLCHLFEYFISLTQLNRVGIGTTQWRIHSFWHVYVWALPVAIPSPPPHLSVGIKSHPLPRPHVSLPQLVAV